MHKLDPAFLFEAGDRTRAVKRITANSEPWDAYVALLDAKEAVNQTAYRSVYSTLFRGPLVAAAQSLILSIDDALTHIVPSEGQSQKLNRWQEIGLHNAYGKFETILISELQSLSVYLVTRKGGFDVDCMVEAGSVFFSQELEVKAPEALKDAEQAMRCLAFEVPTAAGFHLHRANEAVLRVYWDSVTAGEKRPKENNMGVYLRELENKNVGNKQVRDHLRSIKDFHRNPLMHPDHTLESIDEAIDLMAAVRCSIGYMLAEIPLPSTSSGGVLPPLQQAP
jgi:hypothetical protein